MELKSENVGAPYRRRKNHMAYRRTQPAPDAVLISIQEFARRMGFSVGTARKLAYGRKISTVRITKNLMVPCREVTRLIEENTVPAACE
jgi:hypothetical protein